MKICIVITIVKVGTDIVCLIKQLRYVGKKIPIIKKNDRNIKMDE